jgi:hypothetical protein
MLLASPIGNMFSIYTELVLLLYLGASGAWRFFFFETSSNTATPRNIKHRHL